ncbi:MAG: hypothetical protein ACFFB7_05015 [Candidatus Sifarchaeia archaeon]
MMLNLLTDRPSNRVLKYIIIFSFVLILFVAPIMLGLLELSNYAGTIDDTQLGFNGDIIKSYFALMSGDEITLFIIANMLDYLFLISLGLLLFSSILLIARGFGEMSNWRKVGLAASSLGVWYSILDGTENVFLFAMASNPLNFPNWLAIAHSSFAFVKFCVMYVTLGWLIVGGIILIAVKIRDR